MNTARLRGRRRLRFESVEGLWRDVEACAAAEGDGRLECLGNWTFGQILGHLAFWASAPYEGYPPMRRPPWPLRLLMRPLSHQEWIALNLRHAELHLSFVRVTGAAG